MSRRSKLKKKKNMNIKNMWQLWFITFIKIWVIGRELGSKHWYFIFHNIRKYCRACVDTINVFNGRTHVHKTET